MNMQSSASPIGRTLMNMQAARMIMSAGSWPPAQGSGG